MKLIDQIKDMKILISSVVALVIGVIFVMNYFTPASVFSAHVKGQELKELIYTTTQYQITYKCYRESCQGNMPNLLYIEYVKMLAKIDKLKGK